MNSSLHAWLTHLYLITHGTIFGNSEPLQYAALQLPVSVIHCIVTYVLALLCLFSICLCCWAVYYYIVQCSDFSKSWKPDSHTNLWQQSLDFIPQVEYMMFGLRAYFPNSETNGTRTVFVPFSSCWFFVLVVLLVSK